MRTGDGYPSYTQQPLPPQQPPPPIAPAPAQAYYNYAAYNVSNSNSSAAYYAPPPAAASAAAAAPPPAAAATTSAVVNNNNMYSGVGGVYGADAMTTNYTPAAAAPPAPYSNIAATTTTTMTTAAPYAAPTATVPPPQPLPPPPPQPSSSSPPQTMYDTMHSGGSTAATQYAQAQQYAPSHVRNEAATAAAMSAQPPSQQQQQQQSSAYNNNTSASYGVPSPPPPRRYAMQPPVRNSGATALSPVRLIPFDKAERSSNNAKGSSNDDDDVCYSTMRNDPPYAATRFVARDDGNASPKYLRMTTGIVPADASTPSSTAIPLGAVLSPLSMHLADAAVEAVPLVRGRAPVRCHRCRGYLSCHARFVHDGRQWLCPLCGMLNDVSDAFFCNVDAHGRRLDAAQTAELVRGSVEYDVDDVEEYALRTSDDDGAAVLPARPLHLLFLIDVSAHAQRSFLADYVAALREALPRLAECTPTARVAFVTFARRLHFYNVRDEALSQLCVGDVDSPFVPLPFTRLCWLTVGDDGDAARMTRLLDSLCGVAAELAEDGCALGAAVQVAMLVLAGQHGGHVVACTHGPPTSGVGALRPGGEEEGGGGGGGGGYYYDAAAATGNSHSGNRSSTAAASSSSSSSTLATLYAPATALTALARRGRDKDALRPADGFWTATATAAARAQIAFDLFVLTTTSRACELVTLSQLCHVTHGTLHYMPRYCGATDAPRLRVALEQLASDGAAGYAAVLRVRCSPGLRVERYRGHYLAQTVHDMDLASVPSRATFFVQFAYDGSSLNEGGGSGGGKGGNNNNNAYVQAALLYTTRSGQRRVRVHSATFAVATTAATLFKHVDLEATLYAWLQEVMSELANKGVVKARELLLSRLQQCINTYSTQHIQQHTKRMLYLPTRLRLLPVLCLCLLHSNVLCNDGSSSSSSGDTTTAAIASHAAASADARVHDVFALLTLPVHRLIDYVYPVLYALHEVHLRDDCGVVDAQTGRCHLPRRLQLIYDSITTDGVYALCDAQSSTVYLWIGDAVPADVSRTLFGSDDARCVCRAGGPSEAEFNERLRSVLYELVVHEDGMRRLVVVHHGDDADRDAEAAFFAQLKEDAVREGLTVDKLLTMLYTRMRDMLGYATHDTSDTAAATAAASHMSYADSFY